MHIVLKITVNRFVVVELKSLKYKDLRLLKVRFVESGLIKNVSMLT